MNGQRRRYIVKLKDIATYLHPTLNLIGLVVEFSVPRSTKGTDYCTILKIIDQSQENPELSVNVFMRNIDQLPHLQSHKDIILLCNVKMESYKGNYYAVFHHRTSSFALFENRVSDSFTPYQVSSNFQSSESDKDFIISLRNWSQKFRFDTAISPHVVQLKDIRGDFMDLVCEVVYACEVSGNWMLFVWDGTDAPALSLMTTDEQQNPLSLQIEPAPLPRTVLRNFPHVGTVLRVVADKTYENLGDHVGDLKGWMRLRNLHLKTESGLWKGILEPSTKIRPLTENENIVIQLLRNCNERISEGGRVPSSISGHISNFLTAVPGYEQTDFATVMDLLTTPLAYGVFKCVVRMVAVYPSQAKDFRAPNGDYRIRFTLEDPTARIHAVLAFEDADVFFGRYLPVNILETKMNKLLGVPDCRESPRNPPWIQCCIRFCSTDENDILGSRHYHICCTKLII